MSTQADSRFNFTVALTAKMLEESYFPWMRQPRLGYLSQPRLDRVAIAATLVCMDTLHAPRPDQLLEQTRPWAQFFMRSSARAEATTDARAAGTIRLRVDISPKQVQRRYEALNPGVNVGVPLLLTVRYVDKLLQSIDTDQNKPPDGSGTPSAISSPRIGFLQRPEETA